MLSKNQRVVLRVLNDNCGARGSCLMSLSLISALCKPLKKITDESAEKVLTSLSVNGFIRLIKTYKKTEPYFCITLTEKGRNYKTLVKEGFLEIKNRLIIASLCAIVSFIIGRILFLIFN